MERFYTCLSCDQEISSYRDLPVHNRDCHQGNAFFQARYPQESGRELEDFVCKICDTVVKGTYKQHYATYHKKSSYMCVECGYFAVNNDERVRHKEKHAFNTSYTVIAKTENITMEYECGPCGRKFPNKRGAIKHAKVHEGDEKTSDRAKIIERSCECRHCGMKFSTKVGLDRHVKVCKRNSHRNANEEIIEEACTLENTFKTGQAKLMPSMKLFTSCRTTTSTTQSTLSSPSSTTSYYTPPTTPSATALTSPTPSSSSSSSTTAYATSIEKTSPSTKRRTRFLSGYESGSEDKFKSPSRERNPSRTSSRCSSDAARPDSVNQLVKVKVETEEEVLVKKESESQQPYENYSPDLLSKWSHVIARSPKVSLKRLNLQVLVKRGNSLWERSVDVSSPPSKKAKSTQNIPNVVIKLERDVLENNSTNNNNDNTKPVVKKEVTSCTPKNLRSVPDSTGHYDNDNNAQNAKEDHRHIIDHEYHMTSNGTTNKKNSHNIKINTVRSIVDGKSYINTAKNGTMNDIDETGSSCSLASDSSGYSSGTSFVSGHSVNSRFHSASSTSISLARNPASTPPSPSSFASILASDPTPPSSSSSNSSSNSSTNSTSNPSRPSSSTSIPSAKPRPRVLETPEVSCHICFLKFQHNTDSFRLHLIDHMLDYAGKTICPDCSANCMGYENMVDHFLMVHGKLKRLVCPHHTCVRSFRLEVTLNIHKQIHQ